MSEFKSITTIENIRTRLLGEFLCNQLLENNVSRVRLIERSKEIDVPLNVILKICRLKIVKNLKNASLYSIKDSEMINACEDLLESSKDDSLRNNQIQNIKKPNTNYLIINNQKIEQLNGPSSFTMLKPNDNKLPFVILLGYKNNTIKGQCIDCDCQTYPLHENEYEISPDCSLHSFSQDFLKAIEQFVCKNRKIDINTGGELSMKMINMDYLREKKEEEFEKNHKSCEKFNIYNIVDLYNTRSQPIKIGNKTCPITRSSWEFADVRNMEKINTCNNHHIYGWRCVESVIFYSIINVIKYKESPVGMMDKTNGINSIIDIVKKIKPNVFQLITSLINLDIGKFISILMKFGNESRICQEFIDLNIEHKLYKNNSYINWLEQFKGYCIEYVEYITTREYFTKDEKKIFNKKNMKYFLTCLEDIRNDKSINEDSFINCLSTLDFDWRILTSFLSDIHNYSKLKNQQTFYDYYERYEHTVLSLNVFNEFHTYNVIHLLTNITKDYTLNNRIDSLVKDEHSSSPHSVKDNNFQCIEFNETINLNEIICLTPQYDTYSKFHSPVQLSSFLQETLLGEELYDKIFLNNVDVNSYEDIKVDFVKRCEILNSALDMDIDEIMRIVRIDRLINQGKALREFKEKHIVSQPEYATTKLVLEIILNTNKLNGKESFNTIHKILHTKNDVEIDVECIDHSLKLIENDDTETLQHHLSWSVKISDLLPTRYRFLVNHETLQLPQPSKISEPLLSHYNFLKNYEIIQQTWSIKIFKLFLSHYKFLINYSSFHKALTNINFENFIEKNSYILKQVDKEIPEYMYEYAYDMTPGWFYTVSELK